jgi:multidrug resistance efflux pump
MSWILALIYCAVLWLVFAKLKLMKLSLPVAVVAASVGPSLIILLLLCAQYLHPFTTVARSFQEVVPVIPQLRQAGRVTEVSVERNTPIKKGDVLFRVDEVPYRNSVSRLTAALEEANQGEKVAEASVELAQASLTRTEATLKFATDNRDRIARLFESKAASQQDFDFASNQYAEADAAFSQATASLTQARLSVNLAKAKIDQVATQLADAQYDLDQTTVRAPGDGYVTNLQLREGMLVGGPGAGAIMSFVLEDRDTNRGVIVAAFNQKNFLRLKPGQYAEVALHGYPGQIFTGRVVNAIDVSGAGQLTASGILPSDLGGSQPTLFAARIKLDNGDELRLPGGSQAEVAVYTEELQIAGVPVMFLIRAQSWLRYVM